MARAFDPIQTLNSRIAGSDGARPVLDELGLHAQGYALPLGVPFRYAPTVRSESGEMAAYGSNTNLSQDYLALRSESGLEYVFRLDPVISVGGKNVITRRYVAKVDTGGGSGTSVRSGSVKESWSRDDFEIAISGVLTGESAKDLNDQVQELRTLLESGVPLGVENDWLNDGLGITRIVVESFSFPPTKGLENQAYSINCYSDSGIDILEELQ